MKIYVDTTGKQLTASKDPEPKNDQNGKQKIDREGAPMWTTQVMALDETGAEVLGVTVAGVKPNVTVGQLVLPVGLEAIPWANNGRNGVAFRAVELKVPQPASVKG